MAVTAYVTHTAPKHPLQTDWHSLVEVEFTNAAQEGQEASQEIEDENLGDAARVRTRHRTQNGLVKHLGKPTNPWKSLQGGQCLSTSQHFINMKEVNSNNKQNSCFTHTKSTFFPHKSSFHTSDLPCWFAEPWHGTRLARHGATGKHRSEWHRLESTPMSETPSHK